MRTVIQTLNEQARRGCGEGRITGSLGGLEKGRHFACPFFVVLKKIVIFKMYIYCIPISCMVTKKQVKFSHDMLNSDDFRFSACFSASMDFSSVFFSYLELQRYDPDCQQLQDVFRSSGIQKQETSAPPEVEQIAPEKVTWPFLVGEANVFQRGPTRWAQQPVISMG